MVDMLQISARWDPDEPCRPTIDDAPVFYPTIEVLLMTSIFMLNDLVTVLLTYVNF